MAGLMKVRLELLEVTCKGADKLPGPNTLYLTGAFSDGTSWNVTPALSTSIWISDSRFRFFRPGEIGFAEAFVGANRTLRGGLAAFVDDFSKDWELYDLWMSAIGDSVAALLQKSGNAKEVPAGVLLERAITTFDAVTSTEKSVCLGRFEFELPADGPENDTLEWSFKPIGGEEEGEYVIRFRVLRSHVPAGLEWSDWESLGHDWRGDPVVAQNADGRMEVFMAGRDNALYHASQTQPSNGWSDWKSLGGERLYDPRWPYNPIVALNVDGRLEIFVLGRDNALHHKWQTTPGGDWSEWKSMGGDWHVGPVVSQRKDGRLGVFMIGTDHAMYHKWQDHDHKRWSEWECLGGKWPYDPNNYLYNPIVAQNCDGWLEIFMVGTDHALYHKRELGPGSQWTEWESFSGAWLYNPVVEVNEDGRLEIFAVGRDSAIWHKWQNVGDWQGWSDNWESLGGKTMGNLVVASNADGRLEVFVVGMNNAAHHKFQVAPNSDWSHWESFGEKVRLFSPVESTDVWVSTVHVGRNVDGRLEIFLAVTDYTETGGYSARLYHKWQIPEGQGWSDWHLLGGTLHQGLDSITVGRNADGRTEVFIRAGGEARHIWQVL